MHSSLKYIPLALAIAMTGACSDTSAQTKTDAEPAAEKAKAAQETKKETADIVATDLGGGVQMLVGEGGNIGVFSGADGHLVVDDQFARMVPKILAAIKSIDDKPVRYLINSHYHGDHSGGNIGMREHGADIIAHDNVRVRLSTPTENKLWGRTVQPVAEAAWPVITYSEGSTIYINGSAVEIIHVPNAHTDGDSLIYFKEADVLHMGDTFFHNMLPYIDVDSGGSIVGAIAAHDKALSMITDSTQIIPGHGPLATKADLQKTRDMLADMKSIIMAEIESGDSVDTIAARNPLEKYKEYGSFITPEIMTKIIFRSLTNG